MKITKQGENLHIEIDVPLTMKGTYMFDKDEEWEKPAICVRIKERYEEYSLNHMCYLDYKDSLQTTAPIVHFDSKEEVMEVARKFNLPVEEIL